MKILDQRTLIERRFAVQGNLSGSLLGLGKLAGRIADSLTRRRVQQRTEPTPKALVVSVGNLRVGGTGKTPVVLALAQELARRGHGGAVLTRGYGAADRGPRVIDAADETAADEARVLASGLADGTWTVVQSRQRVAGLSLLLGQNPRPAVILLEDGFQTAKVGRHLDILILDDWHQQAGKLWPRTGAALPFGPYRETSAGASRAQIWLLEDDLSEGDTCSGTGAVVTGFQRTMSLQPEGESFAASDQPVFGLISGLARPQGFEQGCRRLLTSEPALAIRNRDHCAYDADAVEAMLSEGRSHGVTDWVTTEKDWVKLSSHWPAGLALATVRLSISWHGKQTLPDLVEERLTALGAGPKGI